MSATLMLVAPSIPGLLVGITPLDGSAMTLPAAGSYGYPRGVLMSTGPGSTFDPMALPSFGPEDPDEPELPELPVLPELPELLEPPNGPPLPKGLPEEPDLSKGVEPPEEPELEGRGEL